MKKIALMLYTIAATGVLVADLVSQEWLYMLCKPLLMASLLFYYLFSCDPADRSRTVFLAIVFSFVGDVLLMKDQHFVMGLVSFLIAHVMYTFAYRQHRWDESEVTLQGFHRIRLAFPVILGGTGLIVVLYPVLTDMRIPVIIYAIVLMLMVIQSIFRMGRTSPESFWMVFGGAVLFMISDSLIAMNKFLDPFPLAEFWIMLTYAVAQFFIVRGLLLHLRVRSAH